MKISIKNIVDIDKVIEESLILEALAESSFAVTEKLIKKTNGIDQNDINVDTNYELKLHIAHVFDLIFKRMVFIATQTRILQDNIDLNIETEDDNGMVSTSTINPDKDASEAWSGFMSVHPKNASKVSIRESCNKIIHAEQMEIGTSSVGIINEGYKYWDGNVHLSNVTGNKNWKITLNIPLWSRAIMEYHKFVYEHIKDDWYSDLN